jgi:hypothetical protein
MGARSNIAVTYRSGETIYLYGHWLGNGNQTIVAEAISEGRRLDDESYFARILFSKMVAEDINGDTGFGIAPYMVDSDYGYPTVTVDFRNNTVHVEGWGNSVPFDKFLEVHSLIG